MKSSKKLITIFSLICLLIMPLKPKADRITFGDVLDELAELERQKAEKDYEKEITEDQYNKISQEIINIENDIAKLSLEIQEATKQINQLEKDIESKKEETDDILVFLQLSNGEKSYLEYIFKSKSFTDFIHRVSVVEQLSKYNKEQIKEMNDMITKNNELKKQNAETIKKQEAKKIESNAKMKELGSRIKEMNDDSLGIEDQIKSVEDDIKRMKEAGCKERNDKLSVCYPMITATGFLRPLEKGFITSEYLWRISPITNKLESHSGIDIGGISEGTPVYPVANGEVLYKVYGREVYNRTGYSCGGNMLYIKHIVNGKQYTSVYMHLLDFANIKVGDTVKYDQVIGYVGGGTTSVKYGGYDSCTTGTHLHLTLSRGHTTNHRSTMFNPREVIEFPSGRTYFNTRYF